MPAYEQRGDFRVSRDDIQRAEEVFGTRSERSRALDKSLRGPITTDVERYADAQGRIFDFPGVDTPTDEPRQAAGDLPFVGERAEMARGRSANGTTVSDDQRPIPEAASEDVDRMKTQGKGLFDALTPF